MSRVQFQQLKKIKIEYGSGRCRLFRLSGFIVLFRDRDLLFEHDIPHVRPYTATIGASLHRLR